MKSNYIVRRYLYYLAQNVECRRLTGIEARGAVVIMTPRRVIMTLKPSNDPALIRRELGLNKCGASPLRV